MRPMKVDVSNEKFMRPMKDYASNAWSVGVRLALSWLGSQLPALSWQHSVGGSHLARSDAW
uniref:Uncharacterized protein n=1 Tax=Meloidogyne incognita TaxID=6306 RepID=A0A914LDW9_MELIC